MGYYGDCRPRSRQISGAVVVRCTLYSFTQGLKGVACEILAVVVGGRVRSKIVPARHHQAFPIFIAYVEKHRAWLGCRMHQGTPQHA